MDTTSTALPARRPRRSRLLRVLIGLVAFFLIAGALLLWAIGQMDVGPIHVTINGVEQIQALDLATLPRDKKLALVAATLCAVLVAMLVLPMVLLAVTIVVALALLAGIGLPVVVALAITGLVLSPLLAIGWLVWWLVQRLRRSGRNSSSGDDGPGSTTIGA